ncbi:hypothetical protein F2P81_020822 [Scophthalmus maximus]|uniref:Uncharacterized protein n=1 Tax=Scophthalmus maximus TaxID=52904 RepID=A0A6A4S1F0_SCOMX|nr:hypothetical protein F2P81_020822 [Scophthalmus maximus]
MSMRSGGEAALSLRVEVVVDRERERDSLRRFLFASRDFERFFDLSRSLDRDLVRLRFLLCLLLFECLDRDELRLRERPMLTTSTSRRLTPNCCVLAIMCKISRILFDLPLFERDVHNYWSNGNVSEGLFWRNNNSKMVIVLPY